MATPDATARLLQPALRQATAALGSIAADDDADLPGPVVRILRFKRPTKKSLEIVHDALDADHRLRKKVAARVDADVGEAGRLWLDRPRGWRPKFDALVEAEPAPPAKPAAPDAGRRARLAAREAKTARQKAEFEAKKTAAKLAREKKARNDLEAELGRLRKLVATLEAELAAARDSAGAEAERAAEASRRRDELGAEAARLRAERDALDRRLAALDDLTQAAHEIVRLDRRGAEAGAAARPPARRRRRLVLPGLDDESADAARWLLGQPGLRCVIDGYNVTISSWGSLDLALQRDRLIRLAVDIEKRFGAEVVVVFDGIEESQVLSQGVEVRFTPDDVEADDHILALAADHLERPLVVVSSDRRVREGAERLGANLVHAAQLVAALEG